MRTLAATLTALTLAACASGMGHTGPMDAPDQNIDAPDNIDGPPHIPDSPNACSMAFTGVLATWTFTGAAGNQTSTAAASTAPGVTAGDVTRSTGLTSVSGLNSINSSGWPLAAALDPALYYTFSVTPPTGCMMDLTQLAIDAKSSGSGPTMASAATSDDAFTQAAGVATTAASTPALAVSNSTAAVEIRVYGFKATASTGTMRVQNTLTVTGALH